MNDQNNSFFPWDEIQEDNVFPTGCFQFQLANLEDGYSQNSGKRMFKAQFNCVLPIEFAGMGHFENYVTGTDENLTGIVAGTMGARGLKKLLKAAQVPQNNNIEQLCISAKGASLLLTLNCFKRPDDDNFAPGEMSNRISSYDKLGAKDVMLAPVQGAGNVVAPNLPPAPAAMPPVAPVVAPPVAAPVPVQTVAPVAPVAPAVVAPAVVAPASVAPVAAPVVTPVPLVSAPVAAPAPVAPVAAAVAVAPTPPAAVTPAPVANPADPMITCTICNAQVPSSQLGQHVAAHAAAG